MEKSVEMIKQDLKEEIQKTFESHWEESELETSIMQLEYSKSLVTDDTKKWRPTGKSASKQTRAIRMKYLMEQKKFLENQLKFQQQKVDDLTDEITKNRNLIRTQFETVQQSTKEIDQNEAILNQTQQEITQLTQHPR